MNKKGFTLVEIISVVALLALVVIISVPIISNTGENIKKKTLQTKIENIEKAAILYGQNNRNKFTTVCNDEGEICNGVNNGECICYEEKITVEDLIDNNQIEADVVEIDINGNEIKHIINPVDEEKFIDECEIQIYKKYGKIYAIYDRKTDSEKCWYKEEE